MKSTNNGIKRILVAFLYSFDGFKSAFKSEAAFRQDCAVALFGTVLALILPFAIWQKAVLISALLLILLMELVNTAIETIIDRISPEYNELSKKAKDIGSLLVLLSFINASLIWICFLYEVFTK